MTTKENITILLVPRARSFLRLLCLRARPWCRCGWILFPGVACDQLMVRMMMAVVHQVPSSPTSIRSLLLLKHQQRIGSSYNRPPEHDCRRQHIPIGPPDEPASQTKLRIIGTEHSPASLPALDSSSTHPKCRVPGIAHRQDIVPRTRRDLMPSFAQR